MKANYDLKNFLKICHKAQYLIFSSLKNPRTSHFFVVFGVDDIVPELTPVEQIFYIANQLNEINFGEGVLELDCQKEIVVGNKKYRVDFIIEYIFKDNVDYKLEKPLVIEIDGKDYHSSNEQMNYDYERENNLKLAGYDVIRFTGSQVYRNSRRCIKQVFEYIEKSNKTEIE